MLLFGIDKVTKYHLEIPLATTTFQWIMNRKTYNAMSAAQKKVIDDHCTTDWAAKFADPWGDFEAAGINKLKRLPRARDCLGQRRAARGVESVGGAGLQEWADSVRKAGGDPDAVLKELRAALDQYKAALLTHPVSDPSRRELAAPVWPTHAASRYAGMTEQHDRVRSATSSEEIARYGAATVGCRATTWIVSSPRSN